MAKSIYVRDGEEFKPQVVITPINDNQKSNLTTYSSEKIEEKLATKGIKRIDIGTDVSTVNMLDYITDIGIYQFTTPLTVDYLPTKWNDQEGFRLYNGDIYQIIRRDTLGQNIIGYIIAQGNPPTYFVYSNESFNFTASAFIIDDQPSEDATYSSDKIESLNPVAYQSDEPINPNTKMWINPDEDNELTIDEDITTTAGTPNQGLATSRAVKQYVDTEIRTYHNGDTIQLVNNSYYIPSEDTSTITSLTLEYPDDTFICAMEITTGDTAPDGVFPEGTVFVGEALSFEANKTYELNIMNGSVAWGEVVSE